MIFNSQVMLRKENNYFVLYNGKNGKSVTIPLEDGEALRDKNLKYFINTNRVCHLLKLQEMNFINLPDDFEAKNISTQSNTNDIQLVNVLELQSHNNPYKILWGITPKCNLKCLYCWPDVANLIKETKGLAFDDLQKIANQLVAAQVCKVIISGGEALLCKDIWKVIKILRDGGLTVILLSNGTTITQDVLEKAKANNVALGISLDSSIEEINSITRRKKIVHTVTTAIENILKMNIPLGVLVTVTKYNFDSLENHIQFLHNLGVKVIQLQDLRPFGTVDHYNNTRLTEQQEEKLPVLLKNLETNYPDIRFEKTELLSFSNKCFKNKSNKIMQCEAGEMSGYIDFHGNFYPCSFLESFKLGNLLEDGPTITNLWQKSPNIKKLRDIKNLTMDSLKDCKGCSHIDNCDGGCRGDALFYTGDFYGQASRCPKKIALV